jgi:hypothetical protein
MRGQQTDANVAVKHAGRLFQVLQLNLWNVLYGFRTVVFKVGSGEGWGSAKASQGFCEILMRTWVVCMFLTFCNNIKS